MQFLARISRFVGNTFAGWVLLFAILAYFLPDWQERKKALALFCSKYPQIWEL